MNASIDTVLRAETPEGIAIAIRPAGFAARLVAFALDALIRVGALLLMAGILGPGGKFGSGALLVSLFFINWLYPVVFELLPGAATPGKRVMGLEVMMVNGLPITPAGCLIRNLLRAVDMLPIMYGFATVLMLMRSDARRLGDIAGNTVVSYRHDIAALREYPPGMPVRPPRALSLRQQLAISAFAWRAAALTPERAEEIAILAAPALGPQGDVEGVADRLVGIARWLHGQRRGNGKKPVPA